MKWKLTGAAVAVAGVMAVGGFMAAGQMYQDSMSQGTLTGCPAGDPGADVVPAAAGSGSKAEALDRNAATWIQVGVQKQVPVRGQQIALAVILVESNGLNLASRKVPESMKYPNDGVVAGDHLSIGTAQQQVGMGWFDTVENGMKVPVQAASFYRALLDVNGWQVMTFSGAAQAVQRSAFPSRYGQREADAVALYNRLAPSAGSGAVVPAGGTTDCEVVPAAHTTGAWANPLKPAPYTLTSPFGWRTLRGIPNLHRGQDLATAVGTPLHAVCTGTISYATPHDPYGGGMQIDTDCGGGIVIKLMHNSRIDVHEGQKVKAGQVIGLTGNTGNSTGPHSHVQVNEDGTAIEPVSFLKEHGVVL